ncbi:AbrB/MazE/SpoVT family DNA-binding domain-containing protein [Deinococcus sp. RM]|uniref:AbrB/MazE/SpoVT family DNA-binding domain-containing protein n=1 Tax=Deinococcus sp. RM TaxID=2316359 RepID=UPI000E6942DB|nr:AbrB/MazE/SpoVT family DNA-binding domain-containing protein [Deinococcus sp. RM]RIY06924.1 AbrB/MazE/SpoVT family DNA-binding domain-containing protein [Deinococcus sp. RM]
MSESGSRGQEVHSASLGPKYRVIVPKAIREVLNVGEGDTLLFVVENGTVQVTSRAQMIQALHGSTPEEEDTDE